MTEASEMYEFLLGQKPICTQTPIKSLLGIDKHRELRAKYKLELGFDLLADRCDSTFNCKIQSNGCIGRPFPKDDDILEALSHINVEISEGIHRDTEVYFAKATVLCSECPFSETCENSCIAQDSYLRRTMKPDLSPHGDMLVSYDDYEAGMVGPAFVEANEYNSLPTDNSWIDKTLPLDCLSKQQRTIVEGMIKEGKTQVQLSKGMGIPQQNVSIQYDNALKRMEEYGKARLAIKEYGAPERIKLYYVANQTQKEIASKESVSREAIKQSIHTWKSKYL